jgi:hypothetical protein
MPPHPASRYRGPGSREPLGDRGDRAQGDADLEAEEIKPAWHGGAKMSDWNADYAALRQHQEDLRREAENRRLVRALRQSRKASLKGRRSWKVLSLPHEEERCQRGSRNSEAAKGR